MTWGKGNYFYLTRLGKSQYVPKTLGAIQMLM